MRSAAALASWIMLLLFLFTRNPTTTTTSLIPRRQLISSSSSSNPPIISPSPSINPNPIINPDTCRIPRSQDSCTFVKSHPDCTTRAAGLIDYTTLFFCRFASFPYLAYALLALWLAALFYMLGNTAADYFCCSLRRLSSLLRLPPTLAGVTLLPLGNGAPDVFASIAAFTSPASAADLGLNSVLGGALFVTTVVAGLVYAITAARSSSLQRLDRACFIRDACFFLFTLLALGVVLRVGEIDFWGAVCFISIYFVYAVSVAASEVIRKQAGRIKWRPMQALVDEEDGSWYSPLLDPEVVDDPTSDPPVEITLPQWRWASNVAIYAHEETAVSPRPLWGWSEQQQQQQQRVNLLRYVRAMTRLIIEGPLTLPRHLTIPLVEDARWSRPVAVASVFSAPVLLSVLLNNGMDLLNSRIVVSGLMAGVVLGVAALLTTEPDHPPRRFVFPWVAGGFVMSIVWFYIIAKELVALLVSLGVILEIDSALLGLTVLAWGNSMGDLMANVAMAYEGGDGVQVAVSGCYAGPMFNTLAGLGISLLLASLRSYPAAFVITGDPSLSYTIGFLVAGLVWTLVMLPARRMQPSRVLGVGLLALYSLFLVLRVVQTGLGQREI